MALVIKRFRRFMGKDKSRFRRRYLTKGKPNKEKEKDKDKDQQPICYECKKLRHYRSDCPFLKKTHKKAKKKKPMIATWSDSEESSSNEEKEE